MALAARLLRRIEGDPHPRPHRRLTPGFCGNAPGRPVTSWSLRSGRPSRHPRTASPLPY